jgi:hypothetical protein
MIISERPVKDKNVWLKHARVLNRLKGEFDDERRKFVAKNLEFIHATNSDKLTFVGLYAG